MKRFMSDSVARALFETQIIGGASSNEEVDRAFGIYAYDEAEEVLRVAEPADHGCYMRLDYPFHSMLAPGEVTDARTSLADTLWGFVNG